MVGFKVLSILSRAGAKKQFRFVLGYLLLVCLVRTEACDKVKAQVVGLPPEPETLRSKCLLVSEG